MELSGNYQEDLETIIKYRDNALLDKFMQRITLPGPAGGPLITFDDEVKLVKAFGQEIIDRYMHNYCSVARDCPQGRWF